MLGAQSGREFQLDESGQGDDSDSFALDRDVFRIREADRFRFAVTRKLAGDNELDVDAGLRVTQFLARSLERRTITATDKPLVNSRKPFAGRQQINIVRKAE